MSLAVREMALAETESIVEYFHTATPEHLDMLGVDPTRLPSRDRWRERYERDRAKPLPERASFEVAWLLDDEIVGFSTADQIQYGVQANMHLHIVAPDRRQSGLGTRFVRETARLYFETLRLQRLFCQPNALNTPPNRALQAAGFRYVKTLMTAPSPLNYRQPITRWVLERP